MIVTWDKAGNIIGDKGATAVAYIISHMPGLNELYLFSIVIALNRQNGIKATKLETMEQLQLAINYVH